jgi:hypothetical protein
MKICTVQMCENKVHAKGLCGFHYRRVRLTGKVDYVSAKSLPCAAGDCNNPVTAKGYCDKHYRRFKKTGSPHEGGRPEEVGDASFERLVIRCDDPEQCWGWKGKVQTNPNGSPSFGTVTLADGTSERAHRFSWKKHKGPIPNGMHVLHHCDNQPCTNPKHLFLGSHYDNMQDMIKKGRARFKGPALTKEEW